ncbi:Cof-type HAD-IIB family hydrolase [Carboxydothermus pertinax]|uniref:Haloacid dehalogenase n=1 Tax=Carboxydothermus pertinax TaxID=870242 RepID=A0A1L8CRV7_9THEO|nr:Cof-type HAD-IIB family hydrolase [Carboxydothermus pertinax]GAV21539.1 haloacid dehalogenase [Carboxydothermus pertinax]
MRYQLLAVDLDDTFLTRELQVSPRVKDAVLVALAKGIIVTLATGRMYRSAKKYAFSFLGDIPLITYNGALIKYSQAGREIYHKPVPGELALAIYRKVKGYFHLNVYQDDELLVEEDNQYIRDYSKLAGVPFRVVADLEERLYQKAPTKLLAIGDPEDLNRLWNEARDEFSGKLHITKSKPHYLEFLAPEVNKGEALKALAAHLGIPLKATVAVGDSYNDLEMLEVAGLGVAMGNALPVVKKRADFIIPGNDEDGIAYLINEVILKNK